MSPGWHFKILQISFKVEKRMALILPVLMFDKLTLEMPMALLKPFKVIFLSAIMRSSRNIMFAVSDGTIEVTLEKRRLKMLGTSHVK